MSACPHCGCEESEPVAASWWGPARFRMRCTHCGQTRDADATEQVVVWHVLRCPACRSDDVTVTSTRRPIRHHRCGACGHAFKSVER